MKTGLKICDFMWKVFPFFSVYRSLVSILNLLGIISNTSSKVSLKSRETNVPEIFKNYKKDLNKILNAYVNL